MIKLRPFRFHKCLGRFHMLTVKGCSETALSKHSFNRVFHSLELRKYIGYEGHLLLRNFLFWYIIKGGIIEQNIEQKSIAF